MAIATGTPSPISPQGARLVKCVDLTLVPVADDIEVGLNNKIPLWMFGFLY